jgi:L-ascorbate metabolism protein UlaG (beta-lactamase superfamily)
MGLNTRYKNQKEKTMTFKYLLAGVRTSCGLITAIFLNSALAAQATEVLWLGQSAFRITSPEGKVILVDPWLTQNPTTPAKWKNLDELGKVDVILVTHAHGDHLGDGPTIAKKQNVPLYGPAGLDQSLVTLGVLPLALAPRMNKSGTIMPVGDKIKITMVRAEHSSELLWKNPETGKDETHVGGEPSGFIIQLENGFTIYHMGDTGLFSDMKLIADLYHPDLILAPIGGHYVMDPKQAAYATNNWLKPKFAIPMHYASNPFLVGTPAQYIEALGKTSTKVLPIKQGEAVTF